MKCVFRSDILLRKELFKDENLSDTRLNDDKLHFLSKDSKECQFECEPECDTLFYKYQVKLTKKMPEVYIKKNLLTYVWIGHDDLPDQVTQHLPEMNFTQFSSNFGGLFGMWLGLSALAILQYLYRKFNKHLRKTIKSLKLDKFGNSIMPRASSSDNPPKCPVNPFVEKFKIVSNL